MIPEPTLSREVANSWRPWLPIHDDWDLLAWYEAAAKVLPERALCVEVGVAHGRSVLYLCEQLVKHGKHASSVFGVDPWRHRHPDHKLGWFPDPFACVLRYWSAESGDDELELYHPVRATSAAASLMFRDASLDLLSIDGEHDVLSVTQDLEAWAAKVRRGGWISGHDYDEAHQGVIEAVDAFFGTRPRVFGSVWVVEA